MSRPPLAICCAIVFGLVTVRTGLADFAPTLLASWEGYNGYFLTGAPLAADTDGDGSADMRLSSVSFEITAANVPAAATLVNAYLYWGGTQSNNGSADLSV